MGLVFSLIHRFHSIRFTTAQGIPKYKIGFGREKDGRVGGLGVWGAGAVVVLVVVVCTSRACAPLPLPYISLHMICAC